MLATSRPAGFEDGSGGVTFYRGVDLESLSDCAARVDMTVRAPGSGVHIAFAEPDRQTVETFQREALSCYDGK